jgi:ABC-type branched-subunit amino acid transport system ATPase component
LDSEILLDRVSRQLLRELDLARIGRPIVAVASIARLEALIDRLRAHAETTSVVLSSLASMSDYAFVLEGGQIVHEGTATDPHDDPRIVEAYLGRR